MTKLFASDFDGTLSFYEPDKEYEPTSARNLAAIRAYQAEGGLFGVCTGRPLRALTEQVEGAIPFDFYIATTGAALFDRDCRCIWRRDLPRDVVRELYELLLPHSTKPELALILGADIYWTLSDAAPWPIIRRARSLDDIEAPLSGMGIDTTTIEEAQEIARLVNNRFSGVACAYVNLASIDVMAAGCSKGTGLAKAAEHFGATLTAGIGDSLNDLPLLEAADLAYTFPTSDAPVRAAAQALVSDVAEALEDFSRR